MNIYEEVRCDYYTDGFWVVDAWIINERDNIYQFI